jgi:hypothetical protein
MPSARITGLAAVALAASAASAHADSVATDYRVDVQIAAHYHLVATPPNYLAEINVGFTYSGSLGKVSFRDGELVAAAQGDIAMSNIESTSHDEHYSEGGTDIVECVGNTVDPLAGISLQSSTLAPLSGGSRVVIRPFTAAAFPWTCTPGGVTKFPLLNVVDDGTNEGPLDLVFDLPDEATRSGKIIQLVDTDITDPRCPLQGPNSQDCTLHLQGSVTFVRTGQTTEPSLTPLVDPPTPLTPSPVPVPTADGPGDLLAPLTRGKLAPDASSATVAVHCAAGCTLTARAFPGVGAGPRAAARPKALATRRLVLPNGGTRKLRLHFGHAARMAIHRAHGARVEVTAAPSSGGAPVRRTANLRVH